VNARECKYFGRLAVAGVAVAAALGCAPCADAHGMRGGGGFVMVGRPVLPYAAPRYYYSAPRVYYYYSAPPQYQYPAPAYPVPIPQAAYPAQPNYAAVAHDDYQPAPPQAAPVKHSHPKTGTAHRKSPGSSSSLAGGSGAPSPVHNGASGLWWLALAAVAGFIIWVIWRLLNGGSFGYSSAAPMVPGYAYPGPSPKGPVKYWIPDN
jgi:hypothetical protein